MRLRFVTLWCDATAERGTFTIGLPRADSPQTHHAKRGVCEVDRLRAFLKSVVSLAESGRASPGEMKAQGIRPKGQGLV